MGPGMPVRNSHQALRKARLGAQQQSGAKMTPIWKIPTYKRRLKPHEFTEPQEPTSGGKGKIRSQETRRKLGCHGII